MTNSKNIFYMLRFLVLSGILLAGSVTLSSAAVIDVSPANQQLAVDDLEIAAGGEEDFNDPLESFNRLMFDFNEVLQDFVLRPIASAYNLLPMAVRDGVSNFFHNLRSPIILANDVLQGEPERAVYTTMRFMFNSTLGIGGVFDAANKVGDMPTHDEDFGQTLGTWGVGEGVYLVLPILGPSNPRDAIGKYVVDSFFDPLWYVGAGEPWYWAMNGVSGLSQYAGVVEELDQIKSTSIDYYAAIRSMYRQKRATEISNGSEVDLPPIPDLDLSYEDEMDKNVMVASTSI